MQSTNVTFSFCFARGSCDPDGLYEGKGSVCVHMRVHACMCMCFPVYYGVFVCMHVCVNIGKSVYYFHAIDQQKTQVLTAFSNYVHVTTNFISDL